MIVWKKTHTTAVLSIVLLLITTVLYWPMTGHGFINFDDHQYITENPHVVLGLTWSGILWSFQCGYAANWHPLTWISHMVDCELYGLNAGGHHLTSLLFHDANTVLLFYLLISTTGCVGRSFFVAALFAWHPLHVESVAWASERKDVLSGFFWILTLMAYARYAKTPGRGKYCLTLVLFALGLMSKPMLVTLPFVLLLMDFWPLARWGFSGTDFSPNRRDKIDACASSLPGSFVPGTVTQLILEKLPFFGLTLAACILTYVAQNSAGAVRSWVELPLSVRCINAVMSYWRYLGKTFWPSNLAVIYPYEKHWPVTLAIIATLLLAALTVLFGSAARRSRFAIVGWLWFLGSLVPTLGLIQVGSQSMADRYMYIPGIGLFIVIVWGAYAVASERPWGRVALAVPGVAALAGCFICSAVQLRYWRDSEKLFTHVIDVTSDNYVARDCLGKIMESEGKDDVALELYQEAARIAPDDPLSQYNLGTLLIHKGRLDEAITHFALAVRADPKMAEAQNNWGKALLDQNKLKEATIHFSEALKHQPENAEISYNLGTLLLKQSTNEEAIVRFADALRLRPDYTAALGNLKIAVAQLGGPAKAITSLEKLLKERPGDSLIHFSVGLILLEQNRVEDAEMEFGQALQGKPNDVGFRFYQATALIQQHKTTEAAFHLEEALRLKPDNPDALNSLAWIFASDPGAESHNRRKALHLAKQACDLTQNKQAVFLITLAAAYAGTGDFQEATNTIDKALALATADGEEDAVARAQVLQKLFESGHTVADALNPGLPQR